MNSLQSLNSRIKVFGNGTLVIHSVTDKDAGDYLCMARNKIGDDYVVLKVYQTLRSPGVFQMEVWLIPLCNQMTVEAEQRDM
ncbi:matrix-remodeling-associated protein 5 [Crotalus adamanteus]|uniref:Matrix-remodeling-associated protein 5 n=1 Tax=Crotalus adamanteus TaxID=8729 RepID=A0AAW1BI21_CROAD